MECCNTYKVLGMGLVYRCSSAVSCYWRSCASCRVEVPQKQAPREGLECKWFTWEVIPGNIAGGAGKWDRKGEKAHTGYVDYQETEVGTWVSVLLGTSRRWCRTCFRVVLPKRWGHCSIYPPTPIPHWLMATPRGEFPVFQPDLHAGKALGRVLHMLRLGFHWHVIAKGIWIGPWQRLLQGCEQNSPGLSVLFCFIFPGPCTRHP